MSRHEDLFGKVVLAFIFAYLAVLQFQSLITVIKSPDIDLRWLQIAGRIAGFVFLGLITGLTIMRSRPIASAPGWEPRLTAIVGTFCMLLPVAMPSGNPSRTIVISAALLLIVGSLLSVLCALYLGRSFSVMATARKLVVTGPYAYLRHPLYAAESITVLGGILNSWSIFAGLLGLVWLGLQYRRMINEEGVLAQTFPEYRDYAAHTPRIIPALRPYRHRAGGPA